MSTRIRRVSSSGVRQPGQLLEARQLEEVVRRHAASPAEWPVRAGGARSFGPRYVHDVRNEATAAVAVSVHAYSPPLPAMTRYELTPAGLVRRDTEAAVAW